MKKVFILLIMIFTAMPLLAYISHAQSEVNIDVNFNYNTNAVIINGNGANISGNVSAYVEDPNGRLVYIGSVAVMNNSFALPFTLIYPLQGIYKAKIKLDGKSGIDKIFEWNPKNVPGEGFINCVSGSEYDVAISVKNILNINQKEIVVKYNPTYLQVVDLCTLVRGNNNSIGPLAGTDIKVFGFSAGEIVFSLNKDIGLNQWSGIVTVLRFKALTTGNININTEVRQVVTANQAAGVIND